MLDFKTSKKISLKFSLFVALILLFFGMLLNVIYFTIWYRGTLMRLETMVLYTGSKVPPLPKISLIGPERKDPRRSFLVQMLPEDQHPIKPNLKNEPIVKIKKINDERVLFTKIGKKFYATSVDQQIEMQIFLAWISLFLLIGFSVLSYFLGIYFVKSSLGSLQKLVSFVKKMDIE